MQEELVPVLDFEEALRESVEPPFHCAVVTCVQSRPSDLPPRSPSFWCPALLCAPRSRFCKEGKTMQLWRLKTWRTDRMWKDGNREGVIRTLVTMMEPLDKALSPVPTSSGRQSPPLSWPETNEFVMVSNKILSGSF